MKKAANLLLALALFVMFATMLVMGIGVQEMDTDLIRITAYVLAGAWLVYLAAILYKKFSQAKCPHCGEHILSDGTFCPYCGKAR